MSFVNCKTFLNKINEVKQAIQKVSDSQQAKLKNCDGNDLAANTKIPDCDTMNSAIKTHGDDVLNQSKEYADTAIQNLNANLTENTYFNKWIQDVLEKIGFKKTDNGTNNPAFKIDLNHLVDGSTIVVENDKLKAVEQTPTNCRANVKYVNAGYTIADDDDVVLVRNGGNVYVPVLETGREVMIIQAGNDTVTLVANSTELIPPFSGSLKTAGLHAAVSLVAISDYEIRVFGQTVES